MSTLNGIWRTEFAAEYLRKLLAVEFGTVEDVEIMPDCPLDFLEELHYSVKLVTQAIKNKSE
jgi:hypothetical protein